MRRLDYVPRWGLRSCGPYPSGATPVAAAAVLGASRRREDDGTLTSLPENLECILESGGREVLFMRR